MKTILRNMLWTLAALCTMGCSATGYAIEDLAAEINATLDTGPMRVAAGDHLSLRFPFAVELNHETRVKTDGTASFLIVDDVAVEGLTLAEVKAKLRGLYQKAEQDKDLTVDIVPASTTESGSAAAVYVIGEVRTPGAVPLARRRLTLLEAIGEAGGLLKESANPSNVTLVRRVAGSNQMRAWRLDAHLSHWGNVPPIYLQPTDIVVVPNTAIDELNILVDKYIRQMIPLPYLIPPTY